MHRASQGLGARGSTQHLDQPRTVVTVPQNHFHHISVAHLKKYMKGLLLRTRLKYLNEHCGDMTAAWIQDPEGLLGRAGPLVS